MRCWRRRLRDGMGCNYGRRLREEALYICTTFVYMSIWAAVVVYVQRVLLYDSHFFFQILEIRGLINSSQRKFLELDQRTWATTCIVNQIVDVLEACWTRHRQRNILSWLADRMFFTMEIAVPHHDPFSTSSPQRPFHQTQTHLSTRMFQPPEWALRRVSRSQSLIHQTQIAVSNCSLRSRPSIRRNM